jgi:hypothetical protein
VNFGTYGFPQGLGASSGLYGFNLPAYKIPWTPTYAAPVLWFDASDVSTIIESSNLISQWTNKGIASSNNATASGSQRPTFRAYQLNGVDLVSVRARGVGMVTGYNLTYPYSIVLVTRNYTGGRIVQGATINALMCPSERNSASFYINTSSVKDAALTTAGVWSTITMQVLGTSPSQLWYNSTNYASGIHGNWSNFNIGTLGTFNENPNADIAEIFVFNYSLNESDRQKLEGYIAYKWGLVSDLPVDHPYKILPPTT